MSNLGERDEKFVAKNLDLLFEFEKYILEHPEFAEKIPQGTVISLQVEGDEEFNRWSRELAQSQVERGQPIIYIRRDGRAVRRRCVSR